MRGEFPDQARLTVKALDASTADLCLDALMTRDAPARVVRYHARATNDSVFVPPLKHATIRRYSPSRDDHRPVPQKDQPLLQSCAEVDAQEFQSVGRRVLNASYARWHRRGS